MPKKQTDTTLENLLQYIRENRGFDFTGYKRTSLERRIQKRLATISIKGYDDYVDYLEVHPSEFSELFNTILINVTSFFRDKPAWEYLKTEIIPRIISNKGSTEIIRVWCAGCASGEEAYSLAMLFAEALGEDIYRNRVKIYATDVDEEALFQARRALYPAEALKAVEIDFRKKYFTETPDGFVFRSELRRQVIFGRHDLIQDPPISRLDLLTCRNTLMYLNAETQSNILQHLHFGLREDGYLFLGKAEMMLTRTEFFSPIELQHRIFSKVSETYKRNQMYSSSLPRYSSEDRSLESQFLLWEGALDAIDLAALIVDKDGVLVMANTALRKMFGLYEQDLGRLIQDLELSYRPVELRSWIDRVYKTNKTQSIPKVERSLPSGESQYVEIKIVPLPLNHPEPVGVGIIFTDVTRFHQLQQDLERANEDLETTNEELHSSNEELETTNEELQSTNEELETTNEELQSTNEELETMNEELQSTNEELETLYNDLRQRIVEIGEINAYLHGILSSIEAGVIVINPQVETIFWNTAAEEMWGLHSDEVVGQPFSSLDFGLPIEKLSKPLQNCLKGKKEKETFVLPATNRRGRSFQCRVQLSLLLSKGEEGIIGVIMLMDEKVKNGDNG